jgi:hypothetical protein
MERRRKALTYTPVYDNTRANLLLGYLGDLTLKGALLISEEPLQVNQFLSLAIEFRRVPDQPGGRVVIPARVVWCQMEDHKTYYNVGLEFQTMPEQNRMTIQTALKEIQPLRAVR